MASDNQVSSILLLILIGLSIYFLINPETFIGKTKIENFNDDDNDIVDIQDDDVDIQDDMNYEDINEPSDQINNFLPSVSQPNNYIQSLPLQTSVQSNVVQQPLVQSNVVPQTSIQSNVVSQTSIQSNVVPQTSVQTQSIPTLNSQVPIQNLASHPIIPIVSQNIVSEIINEIPRQQTIFEPKEVRQEIQTPNTNQQQMQYVADTNQQQMQYVADTSFPVNDLSTVYNFDPNDEDYDYDTTDLTNAFLPPLPPGTKPDSIDFKKNNVDKYNAKDFLPKQINDEWFETDFSLAKYQLNDDKLINTEKYIIGINTVGESLKNAGYDLRGTIPNPKFVVSPWNNSTYEPDFNLKPLC
jgi:hypothetical protein